MSEVFADTSYFLALLNPSDRDHRRALNAGKGPPRRLVTTSAVIHELGNALARPHLRRLFVSTYRTLVTQSEAILVHIDAAMLHEAVDFFAQRPDQEWSLTDCISFMVMKQRGVTDALTADHHFQQAGYRALLRDDEGA